MFAAKCTAQRPLVVVPRGGSLNYIAQTGLNSGQESCLSYLLGQEATTQEQILTKYAHRKQERTGSSDPYSRNWEGGELPN